MKIVVATRNHGKLLEIRQILALEEAELVDLADFPQVPIVEESGVTFAENATLKARQIMAATGLPTLADDSGLEVDALNGEPGVRSARYAGDHASDQERIAFLLSKLQGIPRSNRSARFRCAVAFVDPAVPERVVIHEGFCEGHILEECRGQGGFGYDPIFFAEALGQTFAEASAEEKNRVSHRGQAMHRMAVHLRDYLQQSTP